ncbi:MAG TPA: O-acetyl-ADP-ribose deacetylase [Candidatus Nanopelagicales bacterium]
MTRIEVVTGDLTTQEVDAIVNAANSELLGGGGLDGAIHAAGGEVILEECIELRRTTWRHGLPTGEAVVTSAGALPARWVIHTVGPRHGRHHGMEASLLAGCHTASLDVAWGVGARSVAFPAISCGAYGYPPEEAALISVGAVQAYVDEHPTAFEEVRFVLLDERMRDIFTDARARREGSGTL